MSEKYSVMYKLGLTVVLNKDSYITISNGDVVSISFVHNYDTNMFPLIRIRLYTDLKNIQDMLENPDSIYVSFLQIASPLVYYNYGETCFGIRRAIERCMHFGFSYYTLRVLARCALINGEYDAVRKYLRLLEHSTFPTMEAHLW